MFMDEYPHIYTKIRKLAGAKQAKDIEEITKVLSKANQGQLLSSIRAAYENTKDQFDSVDVELKTLHEIFEETKETMLLDELIKHCTMKKESHEKLKSKEELAHESEGSDIQYSDVESVGVDCMYHELLGKRA